MAKRVTARIPDEVDEKVKVWSEKLGVTQSQLMGMAIQAGIDSIIRAISPADALTPVQWAAIVKAVEEQNLPKEKPGEEQKND